MDSRAKQRLTGAIILVALFVLLVPELLTGPRNGGGDAPSEEGMRRYTIDLDAPTSGTQPVAPVEPPPAVSLPPVAEAPDRSAGSAAESRAVPGEAAQPDIAAPAPAAAVTTPMSSPPQTVASPASPASVAPKPAGAEPRPTVTPPVPRPETAARTDTARTVTAAVATPRGGFAVQLGSFVSKENAERLVRDMNAKGFNAFLAPPITTGGRELYRVRVGPTRDRATAEALAAQLRRIGQKGSIVSIS